MMQERNPSLSPRVWIVLVNWNGWRDTIECLESVLRQDYENYRIVVCDNASSDGSIEMISSWAKGDLIYSPPDNQLCHLTTPPLQKPIKHALLNATDGEVGLDNLLDYPLLLVRTGGNLGFAGGNNVGIRLALRDTQCSYVWLLNNDTVVEPNCLRELINTSPTAREIGIVGSVNCFYASPEVIQAIGGGWFDRKRVATGLHGHKLNLSQVDSKHILRARENLDWVSGASMLISRDFITQIGEMEEDYFLYFEEIDWALRSAGRFSSALAPSAVLYHKAGSATGEGEESAFSAFMLARSRFMLYEKHLPHLMPRCYLRASFDIFKALLRGKWSRARSIARAFSQRNRRSRCA